MTGAALVELGGSTALYTHDDALRTIWRGSPRRNEQVGRMRLADLTTACSPGADVNQISGGPCRIHPAALSLTVRRCDEILRQSKSTPGTLRQAGRPEAGAQAARISLCAGQATLGGA